MSVPALIVHEYKGKDKKVEQLHFSRPGFVMAQHVQAKFKHRLAAFRNTELSKRLEAKLKELVEEWKEAEPMGTDGTGYKEWKEAEPTAVTGDAYWLTAGGCDESDFMIEADLQSVCIEETVSLLQEWWVDGVKVDTPPDELQAEFMTHSSPALSVVLMAARSKVFGMGGDDEAGG